MRKCKRCGVFIEFGDYCEFCGDMAQWENSFIGEFREDVEHGGYIE